MSLILWLLISFVTQDHWRYFEAPDKSFSVYTPLVFESKIELFTTPLGDIQDQTFFCHHEGAVFMVSFWDYPTGTFHKDSIELIDEFFAATIESAAESVNGHVLYQEALQYKGHQGRLWRIEFNEQKNGIKSKGYLVKDRFYLIQVISSKNKFATNPYPDRFLSSFNLLDES
jgi:hypothetical protein